VRVDSATFYRRALLMLFVVALLEGTVARRLAIGGLRPDLGLALVVYAGLFGGPRGGTLLGLLVGLLRGCLDPQWLGLSSLLLSGVGFTAGCTSPNVNRASPIVQGLMLGWLLLGHDFLRALVISGFAPADALARWVNESLGTALYTAILVPILVALVPRLWRRRPGRERA